MDNRRFNAPRPLGPFGMIARIGKLEAENERLRELVVQITGMLWVDDSILGSADESSLGALADKAQNSFHSLR